MSNRPSFVIVLLLSAWAACLSASTPTDTATRTYTYTRTATPTFSSTFTTTFGTPGTATISPTWTASPTLSPTISPTWTASPDVTVTDTRTMTDTRTTTPTISSTWTLSPSPTVSPTSTATVVTLTAAVPNPVIDDFEDGDLTGFNGGLSFGTHDSVGSSCSLTIVAGSTLTLSTGAGHCSGTLAPISAQTFAGMIVQIFGGGAPANVVAASPSHAITFSYQGDIVGQSMYFSLSNGVNALYDYNWTITDTNWHQVTLYFPDVSDPSLSPKLADSGTLPWSSGSNTITYMSFAAQPNASSQPFSFSIDDIYLGEPSSQNSPAAISTTLGMPVSDVDEAYSYHLDEELTWTIIRLAAHCGCHPHDIIAMRSTRSWGQIAIDLGTTWANVLSEVDTAMGSLAPPVYNVDNMERSLVNGGLPAWLVSPVQRYVPASGYYVPAPTGTCP